MKRFILHAYGQNLQYAHGLMKDLPEDKLCLQPAGIVNHPAFVVGHLAATCDFVGSFIGAAPGCPASWRELFGGQAKPAGDRARYPGKDELLRALDAGHARVAEAFEAFPEAEMSKPADESYVKWGFPTVGDLVLFLMLPHEATHLGQVSAWRRTQGYGPLF